MMSNNDVDDVVDKGGDEEGKKEEEEEEEEKVSRPSDLIWCFEILQFRSNFFFSMK